jgi:hypothetical protein
MRYWRCVLRYNKELDCLPVSEAAHLEIFRVPFPVVLGNSPYQE